MCHGWSDPSMSGGRTIYGRPDKSTIRSQLCRRQLTLSPRRAARPFYCPPLSGQLHPGRLEKPVQNRAFLARFCRCIYWISVRTAGVCGRCRPAEREGPSTASPGGMEADNLCSGTAARLNYGIGAAWAGVDWLTSRQLGPSSAPLGLAQLRPTRLD